MHASVLEAVRRSGVDPEGIEGLSRVHTLAMGPRLESIEDDHHPTFLHPGRSSLILLQDVGPTDTSVLAIAMLHESEDRALRVPDHEVVESMGQGTADLLRSLPRPGVEDLVERLIGLGPGSSLAVLAERLDHLRHLHLREDLMDRWAETHAEVSGAWLPFAARINRQLAVRYAHWTRTFVKRI